MKVSHLLGITFNIVPFPNAKGLLLFPHSLSNLYNNHHILFLKTILLRSESGTFSYKLQVDLEGNQRSKSYQYNNSQQTAQTPPLLKQSVILQKPILLLNWLTNKGLETFYKSMIDMQCQNHVCDQMVLDHTHGAASIRASLRFG